MLEIKDVPFRRWSSRGGLVDTKEGKRVIALMHKEMKAGRAVEFWQHPPINPNGIGDGGDDTYDTVSLRVIA